jgi:phosphoglycerate kinase
MITYIDEVKDLKCKKVLLRLDLNVPVVDGKVVDAYRLEKIIQTVDFLRINEARTIIIAHIEDKEGNPTSLLPVWDYLKGYFPLDFCPTYFTKEAEEKVFDLKDKGVLLFENVRNNSGEKENNDEFSKKLANMADIYVDDAFGVCHRKHASIVGVPKFLPHYGGLLLKDEITNLSKVFNPKRPFVFILGGAKFETKLPLITKYLDKADSVFVGGALANNILKGRGYNVGTSLVSLGNFSVEDIIESQKFITPADVKVETVDKVALIKTPNEVDSYERIVDTGPGTLTLLEHILKTAETIVWNGPLGNYEIGYREGTEMLAKMIAARTLSGGESIIGGGDTVAAINTLGLNDKFSFLSTGGGAMLDFLLDETLVGIDALEK